jgi:hypothetical protein
VEQKHQPKNIFDDDELDEAITAADDTGMVSAERLIAEEPIIEATEEPEEVSEEG